MAFTQRLAAALATFGLCTGVIAQAPVDPAAPEAIRDLSPLLAPIRDANQLPALAAVLIRGDAIVAQGVVGIRAAGSEEPATLTDRWHIGSCTKSMTATLVAMLVERGDLSWSRTVGESFPEFAETMDEAWKSVTLEQLLTNLGGAPADLDADGLWARLVMHQGSPTEARLALVEGVTRHPPEAAPGSKFIYSNAGFSIAGAIAEKVTGKSWEDLMRTMLFAPLGMESAGFGAPGERGERTEPRGHRLVRGKPRAVQPGLGSDNPDAIGPAGKAHCSLPDWAKYAAFHLRSARGDLPESSSIRLSPETIARLHTAAGPGADPDNGYAMGWGVTRREWGGRVLTHNGSNTMWFAVVWIAPERDFAVLVATNIGGEGAQKGTDEAAWAVIEDCLAHR